MCFSCSIIIILTTLTEVGNITNFISQKFNTTNFDWKYLQSTPKNFFGFSFIYNTVIYEYDIECRLLCIQSPIIIIILYLLEILLYMYNVYIDAYNNYSASYRKIYNKTSRINIKFIFYCSFWVLCWKHAYKIVG